jgi:hypothetical protein
MALLGAFVFHLPIYWVYPLVLIEELVKLLLGLTRVFSQRWINQLTTPA